MKITLTLFLIYFAPLAAFADESCQARAHELAERIDEANLKSSRLSDLTLDDLDELKKLNQQQCFNYDKLLSYNGDSFTGAVLDKKTMEPSGDHAGLRDAIIRRDKNLNDFASKVATPAEADKFVRSLKAAPIPGEADPSSCKDNGQSILKQMPPIRNQGGAGYCSYYSTADALSVALKVNISAAYLGSVISPRGQLGAGAEQFNYLIKNLGLCSEKTLPSNNLPTIDGSFTKFADTISTSMNRAVRWNSIKECALGQSLSRMFPGHNLKSLFDIARKITNDDGTLQNTGMMEEDYSGRPGEKKLKPVPPAYLSHFALDQCSKDRGKISRNVKVVEEYVGLDYAKGFKAINDLLSAGKPAVIGYDYNSLIGGKNGGHSSSIVERRFINGHCQFLVRNSWGKSSCTRVVSEKDACGKPGYFWVNALDLAKSLDSVSHVE